MIHIVYLSVLKGETRRLKCIGSTIMSTRLARLWKKDFTRRIASIHESYRNNT